MLPSEMPDPSGNEPANPLAPAPTPLVADPAAPPSQGVTRDELLAVVNGISESIRALASAQQQGLVNQRPAEPQLVDPTAEELVNDLNSGKDTSLRKLLDNQRARLIKEHIDPMRSAGMANFESLIKNQMLMDPKDGKIYQKYEKEVDALVASVEPQFRGTANCYRTAIDLVKARHIDDLLKEQREQLLREAQLSDGGTPPSGGGRQDTLPKGCPSVAELLGPEAERDMRNKGWTPDMLTQKLYSRSYGVKTWAEFAPIYKKELADLEGGANA